MGAGIPCPSKRGEGGIRTRSFASGALAPTTDVKEIAGNTFRDGMTRVALDDARQAGLGGALGGHSTNSFLLLRSPGGAL